MEGSTVLVHKVTGAAASLGYGLDVLAEVGRTMSENLVSIGVALERVHAPGQSDRDFLEQRRNSDEVELGMGIHNEAGCARLRGSDAELCVLVDRALRQLLDREDPERGFVSSWGSDVVLLVNNLGGLSALELGAAVTESCDQLKTTFGIVPMRVISGTYMTCLDCRGFSLTLLSAVDLGIEHNIITLQQHPAQAPG
jgi:triose/dihydroxyacetone kinase / FAD-AMP lyase (cyclizing)